MNTFLTHQQVIEQMLEPWLAAVAHVMRDITPEDSILFPNPGGRDMMPVRVYGLACRERAD